VELTEWLKRLNHFIFDFGVLLTIGEVWIFGLWALDLWILDFEI